MDGSAQTSWTKDLTAPSDGLRCKNQEEFGIRSEHD